MSLLGAATLGLPARGLEAATQSRLSESAVASMLRDVAGVEPLPGEPFQVGATLQALLSTGRTDPRQEPAVDFDAEV